MYERILVAIDAGETAPAVIDTAVQLARVSGGTLRLVHVADPMFFTNGFESGAVYARDVVPRMQRAAQQVLDAAAAQVREQGLEPQTVVLNEALTRLAEQVVDEAVRWGADLLVLGSHGRRGVRRLLWGSDAEQIVRLARTPVLVVRPPPPSAAAGA